MKKIFALIMSASVCVSLFAADIFTYAPINGTVKSCTETQYSIASKFGNFFRTPSTKITKEFNANGLVTVSTELTPRDAIINKISAKYDSKGNLTEEVCTNADGEEVWKQVSTYKDGLKIDVSEYDSKNNLKDKTIYTYDAGALVDETSYDSEGALVWKITYKYNAAGKVETISDYSPDGKLSEQSIYKYTDTGAYDTITTYTVFTNTQSQKVFRYGTNGVLNEITTYDDTKQVSKRVLLKYDTNENVIKVSEYDVAEKFGTTVNELVAMSEYVYEY